MFLISNSFWFILYDALDGKVELGIIVFNCVVNLFVRRKGLKQFIHQNVQKFIKLFKNTFGNLPGATSSLASFLDSLCFNKTKNLISSNYREIIRLITMFANTNFYFISTLGDFG